MAAKRFEKSTWSTAMVDDFPDGSFLYIEPGGKKDADGKTTPRSLRHFPYKDENGKIDVDHLRDAIGRIPQSSLPATLRNKLQVKAEKLLAAQHEKAGKRLAKRVFLTTAAAGHTHALDDGDDGSGPAMSGTTSWDPMPGVDGGGFHSHNWVRADDGTIVIGEAENHDHMVLDVNATDGDDDEDDAGAVEGAGKRAGISTPTTAVNHRGLTQEGITMADTKIVVLSEREHAHLSKLRGADADAFIAKSAAEREQVIKAAHDADPIVFKGEITGVEVRKSDGDLARRMAEQNEALTKAQREHAEELKKARDKAELVELEKRADATLAHFGKSLGVRAAILKAVEGIADEALRKDAIEALKGADVALKSLGAASGVDPGGDAQPENALEAYNTGLEEYAKTAGFKSAIAASEAFMKTAKGQELYAAYKDAHASTAHLRQ